MTGLMVGFLARYGRGNGLRARLKSIGFSGQRQAAWGHAKESIPGVGEGEIEVYRFFELCSRILDQKVEYEKEKTEYYNSVVGLTLDAIVKRENSVEPFDAIL
jgi:hypothetical protein